MSERTDQGTELDLNYIGYTLMLYENVLFDLKYAIKCTDRVWDSPAWTDDGRRQVRSLRKRLMDIVTP